MTEDVPTIAEDTLQRLSHRMLPMLSMSTKAVVYCYYRDDTGQPALYCNTNIPGPLLAKLRDDKVTYYLVESESWYSLLRW